MADGAARKRLGGISCCGAAVWPRAVACRPWACFVRVKRATWRPHDRLLNPEPSVLEACRNWLCRPGLSSHPRACCQHH